MLVKLTLVVQVSMISDYENDFVRELANSLGAFVWIGLSDRFSEGNWIWSDGSVSKFTQWNAGESGWIGVRLLDCFFLAVNEAY
jgi:hypothetical protein